VLRTLSLGFFMFVLWLLLSGHSEPLLIILGVASCVAVVYLSRRMDLIDHEGHPIHLSWRVLLYWPWLLWEIVKANVDVGRTILRREMPIALRVLNLKTTQRTELGRVIYANSITLTPGTVTIALEGEDVAVHALTTGGAEGLETGDMDRRVTAIEGSE